ncbi:hypothetical protein [Streptomyces roseolus]
MGPQAGDIVYASRKTEPPPRRRYGYRFGIQRPVLRLGPLSSTDEQGDDWIEVLPLPRGLLGVLEDGEPPWPTLREALGRRGGPTPSR